MLDEAVQTNGLSVLEIVGEAGIGKTTLLEHLSASAHAAGALVLSARCSEYERDVPYALLIDALDPHLAAVDLAGERHELHRAVRALLERLAAPRGLVLILDDLHWADPASIALVASIVRRPPPRLLLAIAHRHRQADSSLDPELHRAADAGRARRLELGPLSPDEASRLLARPWDAAARPVRGERRQPVPSDAARAHRFAGRRARRATPGTARSRPRCARRC